MIGGAGAGLFDTHEAVLVLADGATFAGEVAAPGAPTFGEVVFNTALCGYQEVISDPSYAGQIIVMTYPHIGNYGANDTDDEAPHPAARGLVVRDLSRIASNYRSKERFCDYLERHGVPAIMGIDTRRLTRHIRTAGAMTGGIFSGDDAQESTDVLVDRVRAEPEILGRDLVSEVTCTEPYASPFLPAASRFRVHLVDYGVKRTILRRLSAYGCDVRVFPASTATEVLLDGDPDGIMLSNGPGDPLAVSGVAASVRALLGRVPIFGICLGHQVLSLALGAKREKLPFGHHGANHPVMDLETEKVGITSQNHGFNITFDDCKGDDCGAGSVDTEFGPVLITHRNLNDGTLEGIRCRDVSAFSVQYHPEAGPGPHDAAHLFERFCDAMSAFREIDASWGSA